MKQAPCYNWDTLIQDLCKTTSPFTGLVVCVFLVATPSDLRKYWWSGYPEENQERQLLPAMDKSGFTLIDPGQGIFIHYDHWEGKR